MAASMNRRVTLFGKTYEWQKRTGTKSGTRKRPVGQLLLRRFRMPTAPAVARLVTVEPEAVWFPPCADKLGQPIRGLVEHSESPRPAPYQPRSAASDYALRVALSADPYKVLNYRGNLTGHEDFQPGRLFGNAADGMPFVILDAEYREADDRTAVNLQRATPEEMRAALEKMGAIPA